MSAEIINLPVRPRRPDGDLPLVVEADSALRLLKRAQEYLSAPGIDRRRSGPRNLETFLGLAVSALERGVASNRAGPDSALGNLIWEALGPAVTFSEVAGSRRMLEAILDALPVFGGSGKG